MASVPLHCNICPKHPDFSDISHLLTHVGSKGHLSHYFKAQVRSRQESAVRHQLDIYDRWYAQYQIERLLSQRMQLKETKDSQNKPRAARKIVAVSAKSGSPSKKPRRARTTPQPPSADVKAEEVIDPQLCQIQPPTRGFSAARLPSPIRNARDCQIASMHRAHIPRMRRQQTASPPKTMSSETRVEVALPSPGRTITAVDTESDSEYEGGQSQNPIKMTYPDPSSQPGFSQVRSPSQFTPPVEPEPQAPNNKLGLEDNQSIVDEVCSAQSPTLKGVQWPGMNIFDSASPEAQRKRNQKKNQSIMAQMELNSAVVEPLERIYWPEGGLKKERVITGNVESSPIQEETPKLKRRRALSNRPVLGDLSANQPKRVKKPRAGKSLAQTTASGDGDLGDLAKRGPAMLDSRASADLRDSHSRLDVVDEEDIEWALNMGDYDLGRNRDFLVFDDEIEDERKHTRKVPQCHGGSTDYSFPQSLQNDPPATSAHDLANIFGLPFSSSRSDSHSYLSYGRSSSIPGDSNGRTSRPLGAVYSASANKENLHSAFDHNGQLEDESTLAIPERATQRYFSLTDPHSPRFFDFLPPQMEFGGLADPRFLGTSPNPLNPSAQLQHSQSFHRQDRCINPATVHTTGANRRKKHPSALRSDGT
ncbi:hypothetical protein MMC07_006967 [Pseudocyphellaria aurata]|nr:hypothetical protein [Pseudocyphellaria aurata]